MTLLQRDRENKQQGQENIVALTKILLEENRTDDLKRALEDTYFRNELFEEYNILLES